MVTEKAEKKEQQLSTKEKINYHYDCLQVGTWRVCLTGMNMKV